MNNSFTAPTTYFLQEGRENLPECLKTAFQAAVRQNVRKLVVFTAYGEGIKLGIENFCSQEEYAHIKLIAVTFPAGKIFTNKKHEPIEVRITDEILEMMRTNGVPLVRAHLPFDPVEPGAALKTKVGSGFNLLAEALNMFCGSMSLCVQAIALACDAGFVDSEEHVISLASDTAILAQAAVTRCMLSQLIIREILCKPAILTIGRNEGKPQIVDQETKELERPIESKKLP